MSKHRKNRFSPRSMKSKRQWHLKSAARQVRTTQLKGIEPLEAREMLSATQYDFIEVDLQSVVDQSWAYAANLDNYTSEQLEDAQWWVLRTEAGTTASQLRNDILQGPSDLLLSSYSGASNTWIVTWNSQNATSIINSLSGVDSIEYFYPDGGVTEKELKAVTNDPLFEDQWYLFNTGQLVSQPDTPNTYSTWGEDINAIEAWETATGEGVVIAIVDDGVFYGHADLGAYGSDDYDPTKLDVSLGFDFQSSTLLPLPNTAFDFHGTAVAGIAAASGNNDEGITGVAYDATLTGIRLISDTGVQGDTLDGEALFYNAQDIDIYNNSWGVPDNTGLGALGPLAAQALLDSVFLGRTSSNGVDNLGTIHVFAAGNGGGSDSSNYDGYANSRFTIAVGAVDENGVAASYTEPGANILVVAPGGDLPGGMYTTDLPDDMGYNVEGFNDPLGRDFLEDTDYTSQFEGTSAAAPVVSGVIALMLEAAADNGIELTYRDIETILAKSARQNDVTDQSWVVNEGTIWLNPVRDTATLPQQPPIVPQDYSAVFEDGTQSPSQIPGVDPSNPATFINLFTGNGLQDNATWNGAAETKFVNGAGYTVSDVYGHGVVDAALAVELASSWTSLGTEVEQYRASVGLISPINPAFVPQAESVVTGVTVPGSAFGQSGFGEWLAEFYNTDRVPFSEDDPDFTSRGDYIYFDGPNDMSIEQVELSISITGDADQMNNLRIALESPDGTTSDFINLGGDALTTEDGITWTFSSTQFIGERGGKEYWNPQANMGAGAIEQKQWRLIVDNYSTSSDFVITSATVNFYGSEVAPGRIQGFVGLDGDADGAVIYPDDSANYQPGQADEVVSGVTVWLDIDQDGVRDENEPSQVTGADGNYYFDVPFGTWQIGMEIPEGYEILNLTADPDNPTTVVQIVEVGLDTVPEIPDDRITTYFDLGPQDVTFSGTVYADVNDDGSSEGEPTLNKRIVYLDLNENGEFDDPDDPLEPTPDLVFDETDLDGTWSITQTLLPGYYTIAVAPEDGFTASTPDNGFYRIYVEPGETITGLDFGAVPIEGSVSGVVFNDANSNGVQDDGEEALSGFKLYVDLDGDGKRGLFEPQVTSTEDGFVFTGLQYSTYDIRLLPVPGWEITTANAGLESFEVVPGQTVSGLKFGVTNENTTDYGDLPESYGIAWHEITPGAYLGSTVDGEESAQTSADAMGDDTGSDDEDGVQIDPITPGEMVNLTVTASSNSLYFQGWIDFNDDGDFNDEGEQLEFLDPDTGEVIGKQIKLLAGDNQLAILAPDDIEATSLAARYRYGPGGSTYFNQPSGSGLFGEVEDYYHAANVSTSFVTPVAGDYDGSGTVDQGDYDLWKSTFGSTADLRADGNGDSRVNLADYAIWRNNLGATAPLATLAASLSSGEEQPTGLDSPLALAMIVTGDDGLEPFSVSTDDSDSSAPVGDNNDATDTGAVDQAFYEEEEGDSYADTEASPTDTGAPTEALALALEDDFGDLL